MGEMGKGCGTWKEGPCTTGAGCCGCQGNPENETNKMCIYIERGIPGGSVVRNPPAKAGLSGDVGSVPGLGRSSEEGSGNPLQYSYLRNSMESGAWWATIHGVPKELDMT